jgi:hypothetical protein
MACSGTGRGDHRGEREICLLTTARRPACCCWIGLVTLNAIPLDERGIAHSRMNLVAVAK